jgi:hypothetical protein
MLEAFHPFGDYRVDMPKRSYPIVVYGGSNWKSSQSNNDQVKHSGLTEA